MAACLFHRAFAENVPPAFTHTSAVMFDHWAPKITWRLKIGYGVYISNPNFGATELRVIIYKSQVFVSLSLLSLSLQLPALVLPCLPGSLTRRTQCWYLFIDYVNVVLIGKPL